MMAGRCCRAPRCEEHFHRFPKRRIQDANGPQRKTFPDQLTYFGQKASLSLMIWINAATSFFRWCFIAKEIKVVCDMNIERVGIILGCILLAGTCLASALPENSSNPYVIISERNVFHLNPIPPPSPAEPSKADLPVIKLSGFFKVGKKTRALFSSQPKKKEELWTFYNLAEGEKEGALEVVKIDEADGKVEILNTGTPATLTLKQDSMETAAAAGPGAPRKPGPGGRSPPAPGIPRRTFPTPGEAMTRVGWPGAGSTPAAMRPRRIPAQQ